jgi:hypothetical protein
MEAGREEDRLPAVPAVPDRARFCGVGDGFWVKSCKFAGDAIDVDVEGVARCFECDGVEASGDWGGASEVVGAWVGEEWLHVERKDETEGTHSKVSNSALAVNLTSISISSQQESRRDETVPRESW